MLPAFELEGGLGLALVRGLSVAGLLSVFGALLLRAFLAPPVLARMPPRDAASFGRRWSRLFWSSWATAMLATLGWLLLEAGSMADAGSLSDATAATPTVAMSTSFGHVVLLRLAVLVATGAACAPKLPRWRLATGLAALATILQAGHGHAVAMVRGLSWLLFSQLIHLLAAGAWLGGLLPLLLLVASASPAAASLASQRFSRLGTACVLLLAATAGWQGWVLIGGLPGLVGTGYGVLALLKALLFAVLLGFAAANRFRHTPALATAAFAKRRLCRSIAVESGVGLLVVLAAGLLASLPPSMHVQPNWPFAWQPSLDAVREDAGFRLEVAQAGLALAGAVALFALGVAVRRVRWVAIAAATVIPWFAIPHFDLLLAEAHPTSFYRSPTNFAATAIVVGAALFPRHCAACHGSDGRGDGPAAAGLPVPPANLTAAHLWMHSDGELFWWLAHGIEAPEGGLAMPGFAVALSDDERWDLIDYIRAHNAGVSMHDTGQWSPPVQAPDLQAVCDGRVVALHDLRGRFVRLVIGPAPGPGVDGAVTIATATTASGAGACLAGDKLLPSAYAIVSGLTPGELPGAQFLIDGDGWLRAVLRPGGATDGNDPAVLAAVIRQLRDHPIVGAAGAGGGMDMPM